MKFVLSTLALCGIMLSSSAAPVHAQQRGWSYNSSNPPPGNYLNPYVRYGNPYAGSPYGSNPLYNPAGGYYNPWVNPYGNPYMYNGVPINSFGMPVSVGNGFFGLSTNGRSLNFWKGPSGYYYPWANGWGGGGYSAPIIVVNQGSTQPQPAQPPLSTIFQDMLKYLDEQKAAGKLSEADFTHLKQRALDLLSKERSLRTAAGGSLDAPQETSMRNDVDALGGEIATRVKP